MKKKCPKEYKYIPGKIDFDCSLKKLYKFYVIIVVQCTLFKFPKDHLLVYCSFLW